MTDYPRTSSFGSVTVILPVMTETESLIKTVDIILSMCRPNLREFLIVVCERTKPESMSAVRSLERRFGDLVFVHNQHLPFLGGAMREAFELAHGTHVIVMASDLETDPTDVRKMIDEACKQPDAIITASRWRKSGSFEGYNFVKLLANWVFQRFFSILYSTNLSDLTYGYRLFPTRLVQAIQWEELRHPFLFETIIKPLRLGVPIVEISTAWKARVEGKSQNTFIRNFAYFRTGLKARFIPKASIIKS
jgi:hypothetical protein